MSDGNIEVGVKVTTDEVEDGFDAVERAARRGLGGVEEQADTVKSSLLSMVNSKAQAAFSKLGATGTKALTAVLGVLKVVGITLAATTVVILGMAFILAALVANLVMLAFAAVKFGISMVGAMSQAIDKTSAYGKQVNELQTAFDNVKQAIFTAFAPLVQLVLPWVQAVTDWLIKMINMIAMLVAWALGQETVMQYVAGSAANAASGAGEYANELERANEAAEGALAAFDQINVLQQAQEPTTPGGGAGSIGSWTETPVDPEIWEKFKQAALDAWYFIRDIALLVIATIWFWIDAHLLRPIREGVTTAWEWVIEQLTFIWEGFKLYILVQWAILKQKWNDYVTWVKRFWSELWETAKLVFASAVAWIIIKIAWLKQGWANFGDFLKRMWNNLVITVKAIFLILILYIITQVLILQKKWDDFWTGVALLAFTAWRNVQRIWGTVSKWFKDNVTDPIKTAWEKFANYVAEKWEEIWTGVGDFIKTTLNSIIDLFNGLLRGIVDGINGIIELVNSIKISFPDWIPVVGGKSYGANLSKVGYVTIPSIPLAEGGVIPPNSEFLAVLGDQRSGRNIEAPEDLIRQIVREESGRQSQEILIRFGGELSALVRVLKPYIDDENKRIGKSLISGVVS